MENIEHGNIEMFKEVGELAQRYPYTRDVVRKKMNLIYERGETTQVKQNCFIALTYFENSNLLAKFLVDDFSPEEIVEIILMADDTFDHVIYYLADENLDVSYLKEIFEGVARAYKYDLLFRMMAGRDKYEIKKLIMGTFLHCTTDAIFLEWVEDKELLKYEDDETADQIHRYIRKYGWCNGRFSPSLVMNLYVIIWYTMKLLDDKRYHFELDKINNGVKFIVTYLKNIDRKQQVKNYLIDIRGFKAITLVEFDFHWKKANRKKLNTLSKDPIFMNRLMLMSVFLSNIATAFYYLSRTIDAPMLLRKRALLEKLLAESFFINCNIFKGYDILDLQISRYMKLNSSFFFAYDYADFNAKSFT